MHWNQAFDITSEPLLDYTLTITGTLKLFPAQKSSSVRILRFMHLDTLKLIREIYLSAFQLTMSIKSCWHENL